jgi:hypothetical protein
MSAENSGKDPAIAGGRNEGGLRPPPRQLRPQLSEEFHTHGGDDQAVPSPPYHPSAQFPRYGDYGGHDLPSADSPAYKSTATLMSSGAEKRALHHHYDHDDDHHDHDHDEDGHGARPTVHYPSDVKHAPSYHERAATFPPNRADTGPSSRASSVAGTDDEDDGSDYDWSGEEDLVDQEAKFEQQMGVKHKRTGWGFKR